MRLAVLAALLAPAACSSPPPEGPPITARFTDDFERADLGADWQSNAPAAYQIVNGALSARGAVNNPLWLRRRLPADAVIELTAWSNSADGDLKIELYGDGRSHATHRGQYTSTGYVAIQGGWSNSISVLAAGNEHRKDRAERRTPKVELGRRYHWKLVKRGERVEWFVDDMATPFLSFAGAAPSGGAYLAISNWESDAWFDDLSITPL